MEIMNNTNSELYFDNLGNVLAASCSCDDCVACASCNVCIIFVPIVGAVLAPALALDLKSHQNTNMNAK